MKSFTTKPTLSAIYYVLYVLNTEPEHFQRENRIFFIYRVTGRNC